MSTSSILHSSLVRFLSLVGQLKVDGQRLAVDLRGSSHVDGDALERAMITYQRATTRLEEVITGQGPVGHLQDGLIVDLQPGETLQFANPLSDAIESTVILLRSAPDDAKSDLVAHLNALLAEQRSQLFTSPSPVRDQIGIV